MPKYITFKIKKTQKAQLAAEFAATSAIQNARRVAIVGYIDGIMLTDGACNGIYKELFRLVHTAGRKLEFFIDQQTADTMRKFARMNWIMNGTNVIIHIVRDWKKWSPGELGMKFDAIVANPPYCAGLHLKILQDLMPLSDNIVCIHPASWLQFPTRQRPAFMNGRIGDFQIIDRKEANDMFDIDGGDIVISTFVAQGSSFQGSPVTDPQFCCFKYNSRFDF